MGELPVLSPNLRLQKLISESGMSRAGLAARVNTAAASLGLATSYDHRSVGRWLRGQRPRAELQDVVRSVLQTALARSVTLAEVGLADDEPVDDSVAGFVRGSTSFWFEDGSSGATRPSALVQGPGAVLPVWNWENGIGWTDMTRQAGARVDHVDVARLRAARMHYEQMYRSCGGLATAPKIVDFLARTVAPLLHGSFDDRVGRELARAAGSLVAIAGISKYDADHQASAQGYLHQALRFAKASGDRAFGAYVIALLVNQALGVEAYKDAVELSDVGLRGARTCGSTALVSDLLAMRAKALAGLGEKRTALESVHDALRATGRRDGDDPPEASYVQQGHVVGQVAEALLVLGDVSAADALIDEALHGGAHRWATAASVRAARQDYEHAALAALSMLGHARGMASRRLWRRFGDVRRDLTPSSAPITREAVAGIDDALLLSV